MRSVFTKRVAVVVAVLMLASPVWAGRVQPPVGGAEESRIQPPVGDTGEARLQPPGGVASQSRLQPPVGSPQPTVFQRIQLWLQSRISVPNG